MEVRLLLMEEVFVVESCRGCHEAELKTGVRIGFGRYGLGILE